MKQLMQQLNQNQKRHIMSKNSFFSTMTRKKNIFNITNIIKKYFLSIYIEVNAFATYFFTYNIEESLYTYFTELPF